MPIEMTTDQLRAAFKQFFIDRDHTPVASGSLIPQHRAAPLFTNAGMVPFLSYFFEEEAAPFRRATSSQRCLRVRGKHDDIDIIGRTTRHLTFFEMLGNFSFGDYFKAGAIEYAWEFLTERLGLDGERLWITVHDDDDEAAELWQELVGMPAERIQRTGEDNFWEMGSTGPCGPSSEIFYDRGKKMGSPGGPIGGDEERYVEIWNLVFMQYRRLEDGELRPLPNRNIDTGAGMERILPILQGTTSVFDTDVLRRLLTAAEEATGATYGREEESDVSLRILADHARSVTFLIHDGITPSNEERGYVLRRIIRRAVRHAQRAGATKPTLTLMAAAVAEVMRAGYPELEQSLPRINDALEREESRFVDRLSVGLSLLDQAIVPGTTTISGETAFQLHDTHGFPVELTAEIAAERGLTVDLETFEAEMRRQQELARNAARNTAADDDLSHVRELQEAVGDSRFVGYEQTESDGTVLALELTGENGTGDLYVDVTPFYAESGGQVGDTGTVRTATGVAKVTNTTSPLPGIVRHTIEIEDGLLETGQSAELEVDQRRRNSLRRSHTATHLLHWALRQVLGAQTHQHGSLVAPDALRFDFNHHSPLTAEELHRLEDLVTEQIMTDGSVTTTEMPLAEAKAEGAMSFFGEKYGERVRVVRAGEHSIELCGGTHVTSLGRIGPFIIRSESSVGANLRRIEALVGLEASAAVRRERELLRAVATRLRTVPDEAIDALERIEQGAAEAQRELRRLRAELDRDAASDLAAAAADGVVVQRVDRRDGDALRALAETVRDKPGISAVGLVGSPDGTAVAIAVALNAHPAQAPAVAREAAKAVGGGAGGSNPRTAVGGGRDAGKIDVALQVLRDALAVS